MKQILIGIITLISFVMYADNLPGFLSLFGLTYFIWILLGIALVHAGIKNLKSRNSGLTDEAERLMNIHWK